MGDNIVICNENCSAGCNHCPYSMPHAAACLRQRLKRINAFSAVVAFVCQIGARVLHISVCVISKTGKQPNLGRI